MSTLNSHKLQEAVFTLLQHDETLSLRLGGVYDEPAFDASYPYIAMGQTSVETRDVKNLAGDAVSFEIEVWSNQPTQIEVKELMADVDSVLKDSRPSVLGSDVLSVTRSSASVVRQYSESGSVYRGTLSYQALMYQRA